MKKTLLTGALILSTLLLVGCAPLGRNSVSLVLLILELAIQVIGAIGVIHAAYRKSRNSTNRPIPG